MRGKIALLSALMIALIVSLEAQLYPPVCLSVAVPAAYAAIGFVPLVTDQGPLPFVQTLPASALYAVGSGGSGSTCSLGVPCTEGTAFSVALAGSIKTIVYRGGTYTQTASRLFDYSYATIKLQNYPGETAIIDGASTYIWTFQGLDTIDIRGLTFTHFAAGGFRINGLTNASIRWNQWLNCASGCISNSGLFSSLIDSNTMQNITGAFAISLGYGSHDNKFSHNYIWNSQTGGIQLLSGLPGGVADPPLYNNSVDRNILVNINNGGGTDSGAYYFTCIPHNCTSNVFSNNYLDGNGSSSPSGTAINGFYLDDFASNVSVTGNFCKRCGERAWQIHGGDHNTIANNVWEISTPGAQVGFYQGSSLTCPDAVSPATTCGMGFNVVTKNVVITAGAVPASLYTESRNPGEALPTITNGMYWSLLGGTIPNTTIADASPTYANPGLQSFRPSYLDK